MKTWNEKPTQTEIAQFVGDFFVQLQNGEIEKAKTSVAHAYDDWEETLFTVWEDHYLIHEIPKDNSFEGKEWLNNLEWLKDLTIQEEVEWLNEETLWVDFLYRDEPSGYIGEFQLKKNDAGYYLQRNIFKMA